METSRQRILKTISHEQPDVTPINLEGFYDPEKWHRHFRTQNRIEIREKLDADIQSARPVYTGPLKGKDLSIWGTPMNIYGAGGIGYGAGRDYPLAAAETVREIDAWPWPDPENFDYRITAEVLESIPGDRAKRLDGKYGVEKEGCSHAELTQNGAWIPLICTLFDLFGLEGTLMKMHLEPKVIEAALHHLDDFIMGFFSRMLDRAGHACDLVYFGDDFSTQKGLMISPEHWRRFLLPTYRKLFALIKGHGKMVWFHSCGSFHEVMGDLIRRGDGRVGDGPGAGGRERPARAEAEIRAFHYFLRRYLHPDDPPQRQSGGCAPGGAGEGHRARGARRLYRRLGSRDPAGRPS